MLLGDAAEVQPVCGENGGEDVGEERIVRADSAIKRGVEENCKIIKIEADCQRSEGDRFANENQIVVVRSKIEES